MALFDPNIFDPNIFGGANVTSTTESSVVERKKSKGKTQSFKGFDVRKFRKVFNAYEAFASLNITAFRPGATRHFLETMSVNLDDVDAESLITEAKNLVVSAASKSVDMKTVRKAVEVTSMRPKRVRLTADKHTLLTQARELIEGAKVLLQEKPSLYPGKEPALYGDVDVYFYGEVEFRLDKRAHSEPDECDDYDGQVFSYGPDGLEDGAPNPPLHPNCRCRLVETKTGATMWFPGSEWEGY